jgi:hypothetical protein
MALKFAVTKQDRIAVYAPKVNGVEADIKGGLALTPRVRLVLLDVAMYYKVDNDLYLKPMDKVIVRGDAVHGHWVKQVFIYEDKEIVFCPLDVVYGYVFNERDSVVYTLK